MLQIGTQKIEVAAHAQIIMQGTKDFSMVQLDDKGKPIRVLGNSDDQGKLTVVTKDSFTMEIRTEKYALWSLDAIPVNPPTEPYDPVPIEIAEEEPMTLHEQIRKMVGQMAVERYGESEMESIEDALNFDVDGDGQVGLSGFEVLEDEVLVPTPEPTPEAETEPEPVIEPDPEKEPTTTK